MDLAGEGGEDDATRLNGANVDRIPALVRKIASHVPVSEIEFSDSAP